MTNFIPLKKQSKKLQREFYNSQRNTWNGINPVSKIVPNKKAYDRRKLSKKFDSYIFMPSNLV